MTLQEKLHQLFLVDQQVRGLSSGLNSAKRRHVAQQRKLEQLEQQHSELDEQVRHATAHATTLEKESQEIDTRVTAQRDKMNTVTSNKEYSALLIEVNTLKIEHGKKEEEALIEMERKDRMQGELDELAATRDVQIKLTQGADEAVNQRQADVGDRLDELTKERDAALAQVPDDATAIFELAAEAHDGEAMAVIVEENRRRMEYSCGGCYMAIPLERLNTVMVNQEELVVCPTCSRILYVAEQLKGDLAESKK